MAIRRIVTGTDESGRSGIVSDGAASEIPGFDDLWASHAKAPLDALPKSDGPPTRLEPTAGGVSWRVFDLPPDEVVAAYLASQNLPEAEADGFHRTATLDFVMILDGEVTLELDRDAVVLGAGDCVVQRATRHAWRNRSDRPVRMAVVMIGIDAPA